MSAQPGHQPTTLARLRRNPLLHVTLTAAALTAAHLTAGTEAVLVISLAAPLLVLVALRKVRAPDSATDQRRLPPLCLAIRFPGETGPQDEASTAVISQALDLIAERLATECRSGDKLIRRREDCFVLLASAECDIEQAVQFAFRLQRVCARPINRNSDRLSLTPAIGFARALQATDKSETVLVAMAEEAAEAASIDGPGEVRGWTPALRKEAQSRRKQKHELLAAFAKGEIRPWFQPQVSTDTGEITGVEALARWEHPDRGTVPPSEFLPAIELCDLSAELTQTVIEGALCAWRDLAADGLVIPRVSVNLAPEDLADPSLSDRVAWTLDRLEIAPSCLGVEVLETVVTTESGSAAARNLHALSQLGCYIDLDDFGTGSTSISTIRNLPIRRLKIDRSYVSGVDCHRDRQQMLAAILTMAEQLGLETLGEGVETAEEHAMLAQLGCGHVQGFAVARPMPAEALREWALRHRVALPQTAISQRDRPDAPNATYRQSRRGPRTGKTA